MSYIQKEQEVTDIADAFAKITTELGNAGWTLYDDITATSKVYSSNGETGTEIVGYMHLYYSGIDIYFYAYLYWNTTTHAGTCEAYHYHFLRIYTATQTLYLAGSKDLFFVKTSYDSGVYYQRMFGHVPSSYNTKVITTLAANATAGDGVTLTVASSANFIEESEYQIIGLSEGRDKITVATKPDGTHITVQNLPNDYALGASIGVTPMMFVSGYYGSFAYPICPFDATGTVLLSNAWSFTTFISTGYLDPSYRTDRYILQPISVAENPGSIIGYCSENILYAPSGSGDDLFGVKAGKPENGEVGSAGNNTLTDGNKAWVVDDHSDNNRSVVITSGMGIGQVRRISGNTGTQLTLTNNWTTNPDITSTYSIVDEVYVRIDGFSYAFKVVPPLH